MTPGFSTLSRRAFLLGGVATSLRPLVPETDPWREMPSILARIKPPKFPARDFDITRFGAPTNGVDESSEAIAKAVAACSEAGGGRVVIPRGQFLSGSIRLKSRVNLHLSQGAVLKFVRDPRKYLPVVFTRW